MGAPTCRRCGVVADDSGSSTADDPPPMPLTWSTVHEDGRMSLICDRCTRDHVRDIEGKLDDAWWA